MAQRNEVVFGIDSSYYAISSAKKTGTKNLDYFVSDSISHPFGGQKFGLVVGLNLLELVEPRKLLKVLTGQIRKGTVLLSDPYDYDRGKKSVRKPIDSRRLRKELVRFGFKIASKTKKSSYIPWNLNLGPRTKLQYKVDIIVGKKP